MLQCFWQLFWIGADTHFNLFNFCRFVVIFQQNTPDIADSLLTCPLFIHLLICQESTNITLKSVSFVRELSYPVYETGINKVLCIVIPVFVEFLSSK